MWINSLMKKYCPYHEFAELSRCIRGASQFVHDIQLDTKYIIGMNVIKIGSRFLYVLSAPYLLFIWDITQYIFNIT